MRLSVSPRSSYDYPDPRRGAQAMVDRTVAAREAELDALYIGDHHAVAGGHYANNPMLGRVLAEWRGTTGGLYLLPLWHPVLLAEQIGTLAAIADGRFIFACGLGGGSSQFGGMGVELRDRVSRFEAGLDIVRRLLAGQVVGEDEVFGIHGAQISPLPAEPVEIWLAGHAPEALDRAARLADGWIAGPQVPIEEALVLADGYRQACVAHRREPGPIAIRRDIHVGSDHADAARVADQAAQAGYRGFDPEVLVFGDIGEVVSRLQPLADVGVDEVVIRHLAEDEDEVLASFGRLAEVREALAEF